MVDHEQLLKDGFEFDHYPRCASFSLSGIGRPKGKPQVRPAESPNESSGDPETKVKRTTPADNGRGFSAP
jgi:hypothetical protein